MESKKYSSKPAAEEKEEFFSIKDFLIQCLDKWPWFLASVVLFVLVGVAYILRQQPVFERHTEVLIKDQDAGGGAASISSLFSSMGLVSSNTSVNNELISLTSPAIMYEVVTRLDLEMNYLRKEFPHNKTLYGSNLPVIVDFKDFDPELSAGFTLRLNPDMSGEIYKLYSYDYQGDKTKYDYQAKYPAGAQSVKTPVGKVAIIPNPSFSGQLDEAIEIKVQKSGIQATVEKYSAKLKGDLVDQDAEVINLAINDVSVQRANNILQTIIDVYNENWVEDKNKMAIATSAFIDERLKVIQQELGVVDQDIADFKSQHMVPDLRTSAQIYMQKDSEQDAKILEANNQLSMARYLKDYVVNPQNALSVIPVNTGIVNESLNRQITDYNQLLLARNNMAANSSASNPIVTDYDNQLRGQREAIVKAINGTVAQLTAALRNMENAQAETKHSLSSTPTQARELLSAERQQAVKQSLYLFLLQKREENELTQTFTAYNTRIITPPTGPLEPVSPKKKLIVIVCIFLGLAIPGVIMYVRITNITTIRNRKDLDMVPVPFAGEIPNVGGSKAMKRLLAGKKKRKAIDEAPLPVVEEGNRNIVNEAFRVVRSNIEFMLGKSNGCQVLMLTSFNPGSGKSFIGYNLGVSLALKRKRVLLIDGDLRHASASTYVGKTSKGIANYLSGATDDWRQLLVNVEGHPSMQVLPVGKTPPNPAELLENGRLGELLEQARQDYDYVIIDCPPVDIVVDTQIVNQYVDATIFVVRAGLLEKAAIPELSEIYNAKRYKRMSLILNGTEASQSRYHTYGNYQSFND